MGTLQMGREYFYIHAHLTLVLLIPYSYPVNLILSIPYPYPLNLILYPYPIKADG
jgi:hypothetical protein